MNSMLKRVAHGLLRAVEIAPLAVPAGISAFGGVAVLLLLGGWLYNWLVWPLGLIAAGCAVWIVVRAPRIVRPGTAPEQRVVDIVVVAGVMLWAIWNMFFASQHIFTNRDPATYANAGAWVVHNASLSIDAPHVFGRGDAIKTVSPGFYNLDEASETVHAQGQHLFPVLLGLGGRITGENLMLRLPPLFGAAALLALYGFARLLMRPRWALLGVAVLSVSLPMLYFSRDAYTEPLTLMCVFGALSLLWLAQKTDRTGLWVLAGMVAGAGAMARIDMYITLAGFFAYLMIWLAQSASGERRSGLQRIGLFVAGVATLAVLGLLDAAFLSAYYFEHHKGLLMQELAALGAVIVCGAALVGVAWRTKWLRVRRYLLAYVVVGMVVVGSLILAARPLFYTALGATQDPNVASLQMKEGDPVSPRTYEEITVAWMVWYVGLPLVVLGMAGMALLAWQAARRNVVLAAGILVVAITALVYLLKPSVAPDQIWAVRRLLPVVLPGLIIFAMAALDAMSTRFWGARSWGRVVSAGVALVALALPLLVSRPFLVTRDTVQLPIITNMCSSLPEHAAVLWIGDAQHYTVQATRSFCRVPASSYVRPTLDRAELAKAAKVAYAAGYTPVIAMLGGDSKMTGKDADQLRQLSNHTLQEMEMRLNGPPRVSETKTFGVVAGLIQADGRITELD